MAKEKTDLHLSLEEVREIHEIAKLVAELYVVSLKKGFENEAIATTFAEVFLRELCQLIDEDTVVLIAPQIGVYLTDTKTGDKVVRSVCLKISSGFIRAVTDFLKKRNREE